MRKKSHFLTKNGAFHFVYNLSKLFFGHFLENFMKKFSNVIVILPTNENNSKCEFLTNEKKTYNNLKNNIL
jgi:hypothetical protein